MKVTDIVRGNYSTYQLQELIGKGGNAVVYRGVNLNTNMPVAIKKMVANDDNTIKQWRTEVDALIALRDDGSDLVVQYLDHMNSGKNMLLVEEYAPGGTLRQLVRGTGGLKEPAIVNPMYRVTRGLEYIHSKNIVHRDVKGANVLIFDHHKVKLSDFGLAAPSPVTNVDGEDPYVEEENALLGSVYWMAPEVARGERQSYASDVWSLGCLCVELLTGDPPFFQRTPVNALYVLGEGNESPIPSGLEVSAECKSFLAACFTRDREQRPSAAELTKHAWFFDLRVQRRVEELKEKIGKKGTSAVGGERESAAAVDSVAQWVETSLFSSDPAAREIWLHHHLSSVVTVLPVITPEESFSVIRSFSYSDDPRFHRALGETEFWEIKNLSELCQAECLGKLFCSLTAKQEVSVPHYTPTDPAALSTVLGLGDIPVVQRCIEALHGLLVKPEFAPQESVEDGEALSNSVLEQRKETALQRFLREGGLETIRVFVENKCYSSLRDNTTPAVGWTTLNKLFDIVCKFDELGGAEDQLWKYVGIPAAVTPAGEVHSDASSTEGMTGKRTEPKSAPGRGASEMWFLAIVEGSRHLCGSGAELLLKFLRSTSLVHYNNTVTKAGVSLAGTLLLLASSNTVPSAARIEAVSSLHSLQRVSPRAAQFLRDPKGSIPLLSRVLRRDGSHAILGEEVLRSVLGLCEDEGMVTALAQSPMFCKAVLKCLSNHWRNSTLFHLARRLYELLCHHGVCPSDLLPLDPVELQSPEAISPEVITKLMELT